MRSFNDTGPSSEDAANDPVHSDVDAAIRELTVSQLTPFLRDSLEVHLVLLVDKL